MLHENVAAGKIVNRDIKKALNLCGVQIHGENSVCTGCGDKVCNELCRNRVTASCLTVLPGIAKVGNNSSNAASGCTAAGVNHDEKLHHIVIDVVAGGLNNKYITPTNSFLKGNGTFPIGKLRNGGTAEIHKEVAANVPGKFGIGIATEDFKLLRVRCHFFLFLRHER